MKRNVFLKILNPILGLLMLNQILTGLFSEHLSREAFEVLHEGGGMLLTVGVVLHVILNWNWVKANFFKGSSAGTGQGAAPKQG